MRISFDEKLREFAMHSFVQIKCDVLVINNSIYAGGKIGFLHMAQYEL